jgi:hypothetical protein
VIDTPGLRGLQLDADEADLARAFDDIAALSTTAASATASTRRSPAARCAARCRPTGC